MCLALPGKIEKINPQHQALVNFNGIQKQVNCQLVPKVKAGEFVIVHAGFAIQKLASQEALQVLELFKPGRV